MREQRLGAGDNGLGVGTLGVEMQFARFKDGLEHGQRIKRIHFKRDADQPLPSIRARGLPALAQKSDQRLRRDVLGGVDRKDGHSWKSFFVLLLVLVLSGYDTIRIRPENE